MAQEKLQNTYIDFSDNLELAWNIFLANWRTYLVFLLVINLPLAIFSVLIPQPTPETPPTELNPIIFGLSSINGILGILLNLAISILTEKNIFGQQINPQSIFTKALPKLPIGFIIGVILSLILFIGFILLVIPGIYLSVIFAFCTQAIALRNCDFNAFKYSYNLVKGKWWKVFLRLLQLGFSFLILFLLFNIPSGIITSLLGSLPLVKGSIQVIFGLISSIIAYLFITAFNVYFLNLDYLKNGSPLKA